LVKNPYDPRKGSPSKCVRKNRPPGKKKKMWEKPALKKKSCWGSREGVLRKGARCLLRGGKGGHHSPKIDQGAMAGKPLGPLKDNHCLERRKFPTENSPRKRKELHLLVKENFPKKRRKKELQLLLKGRVAAVIGKQKSRWLKEDLRIKGRLPHCGRRKRRRYEEKEAPSSTKKP